MLQASSIFWSGLLAAGVLCGGSAAAATTPLPKGQVEQAVVVAIPTWQGKKATIVKYLDVTQPFATESPWALVVAQDPHMQQVDPMPGDDDYPIAVCLVEGVSPHCSEFHQRVAVLDGEPR